MDQSKKKIGLVTHYFPKIAVAIVKFEQGLKVGDEVLFKGKRGENHEPYEFAQKISSMQKDHQSVEEAKSGDELGLKVEQEVKEGDKLFNV